jgi:O-acetyl-ADP-ribose deacetylase (regulator of RNase III)
MAVISRSGNLLDDDAQVLVNPVNCVGVMGRGLALAFRRTFPSILLPYSVACRTHALRPGMVRLVPLPDGQRFVANFPTKQHWRDPSRLEWIQDGLTGFVPALVAREVTSVAIPPLGCGSGGLDWRQVRPLIVAAFARAPQIDVRLYEPARR